MNAVAIGTYVKISKTGQIGSVIQFFRDGGNWFSVIRFGDEPGGPAYRVYNFSELEEAFDAPRHRRVPVR